MKRRPTEPDIAEVAALIGDHTELRCSSHFDGRAMSGPNSPRARASHPRPRPHTLNASSTGLTYARGRASSPVSASRHPKSRTPWTACGDRETGAYCRASAKSEMARMREAAMLRPSCRASGVAVTEGPLRAAAPRWQRSSSAKLGKRCSLARYDTEGAHASNVRALAQIDGAAASCWQSWRSSARPISSNAVGFRETATIVRCASRIPRARRSHGAVIARMTPESTASAVTAASRIRITQLARKARLGHDDARHARSSSARAVAVAFRNLICTPASERTRTSGDRWYADWRLLVTLTRMTDGEHHDRTKAAINRCSWRTSARAP